MIMVSVSIISNIKTIIIQIPLQKKNIRQVKLNNDSNQVAGSKKGVNSKTNNSLPNNNHNHLLLLKLSLQLVPIPSKKCNYATLNARKIKKRKKLRPQLRQQKTITQSLNLKKIKQKCQRTSKNPRKVARWSSLLRFPCPVQQLAQLQKLKARSSPQDQL